LIALIQVFIYYSFFFVSEDGFSPQTLLVDSEEDNYIMKTSLAPVAVYSQFNNDRLTGSSIEGIIFDLVKQIEVFFK